MDWTIELERADYETLRGHLTGDVEQVAFLFTEPYAGDRCLRVREPYLVPVSDFATQSAYHLQLADAVRPTVIKRAWDQSACLIEAHSHLSGPARFSASDLTGFEEWIPHVQWRLQGRPYAALVFAPDDFDALVWANDGREALKEIRIRGEDTTLVPTHYTLEPPPIRRKRRIWRRWFRRG